MQRLVVLAVLLGSGSGSAIADRTTAGKLDVSGTYASNWGNVTLRQNGNRVTGTYVYQDGTLQGSLDGKVLHFTWREHDSVGKGIWVVASNGDLIGTWGTTDDSSGGDWRLTPLRTATIAN